VMSEAVERRIIAMLDKPLVCPHGNPIPGLEELGLAELGLPSESTPDTRQLPTLAATVLRDPVRVRIERISEMLQPDAELMRQLSAAGLTPGLTASVSRDQAGLHVRGTPDSEIVSDTVAEHIFVSLPIPA